MLTVFFGLLPRGGTFGSRGFRSAMEGLHDFLYMIVAGVFALAAIVSARIWIKTCLHLEGAPSLSRGFVVFCRRHAGAGGRRDSTLRN